MDRSLYNIADRSQYWDILKGIAILSIVLGHSCYFAVKYVYSYHLALFFFISGYFYNENKYGDDPFKNVAERLRSMWFKYVLYSIILIILHNVLYCIGVYSDIKQYSLSEMLVNILNTIIFKSSETLAGALWFVPVLIVSLGLFGCIVWASRIISARFKYNNLKLFTIIILCFFSGAIGVILNLKGLSLSYHIHTSFLVIPLLCFAYFLRTRLIDIKKYLKWYGALTACGSLYFFIGILGNTINLAAEKIGSWYAFYIMSVTGIYLCMYLAKLIENVRFISKIFAFWGRYTFEIMALHFLIIKLIDVVYARLIIFDDPTIIAKFPYAFSELWLAYAIFGTTIPALIGILVCKAQTSVK